MAVVFVCLFASQFWSTQWIFGLRCPLSECKVWVYVCCYIQTVPILFHAEFKRIFSLHAPPHYNPIIINTSCRWSSFIEESVLLFFVRARNSMCHTSSKKKPQCDNTLSRAHTHIYFWDMAVESYSCAILCVCVDHRIEWLFMMMIMMIWFRWGLNCSCQNVDFPKMMWFL